MNLRHLSGKRYLVFGSVMLSLLFLGACTPADKPLADNEVARIGKISISKADIAAEIESLPPEARAQVQSEQNQELLVEQMIREELLYQEAKHRRIQRSADYKELLADTKRQLMIESLILQSVDQNLVPVTEEMAKQYYERNPQQFAAMTRRHIRHILVKTESEAKAAYARLQKGEKFEAVAKAVSIDTGTKNRGGDLGWIIQSQVVPGFGKVAFGLSKKGAVSGPVKSTYGYHIIQYLDEQKQPKLNFAQVKPQIIQVLQNQQRQQLFETLIKTARQNIPIVLKTD
mgnify:CR=1 FL=1